LEEAQEESSPVSAQKMEATNDPVSQVLAPVFTEDPAVVAAKDSAIAAAAVSSMNHWEPEEISFINDSKISIDQNTENDIDHVLLF
jgi:hypothetical protein